MIIGDTHCRPNSSFLFWTLSLNLKNPDLLRISNCKTFSRIAITIFLYEFSHKFYGFAGCRTSLKRNSLELLNHEHTLRVAECVATGVCSLSYCQLPLIETGISGVKKAVDVFRLGNLSPFGDSVHAAGIFGMHSAAVYARNGIAGKIGRRRITHPCAIP